MFGTFVYFPNQYNYHICNHYFVSSNRQLHCNIDKFHLLLVFLLLQTHHNIHILKHSLSNLNNLYLHICCIVYFHQFYSLVHKVCIITQYQIYCFQLKLLNHIPYILANCKLHIDHQQVLTLHYILYKLYLVLIHQKIDKTHNYSFHQCYKINKYYSIPS